MTMDKNKRTSRPKTRRFLFQYLYAVSYGETSRDKFLASFYKDDFVEKIDWDYFLEMCRWIIEKESQLVYVISKYAPRFNINRMQIESLLPIFIGAYEMLYLKEELPYRISINEAIELSKTYCDDSNRKLVNGVLNNVAQNHAEIKKELENVEDKGNTIFKVEKI